MVRTRLSRRQKSIQRGGHKMGPGVPSDASITRHAPMMVRTVAVCEVNNAWRGVSTDCQFQSLVARVPLAGIWKLDGKPLPLEIWRGHFRAGPCSPRAKEGDDVSCFQSAPRERLKGHRQQSISQRCFSQRLGRSEYNGIDIQACTKAKIGHDTAGKVLAIPPLIKSLSTWFIWESCGPKLQYCSRSPDRTNKILENFDVGLDQMNVRFLIRLT